MNLVKKILKVFVGILILGLILWAVIANYSIIFSKKVHGTVVAVERVELPVALIARSGAEINDKVFSFSVGIQSIDSNEIFTATSEDRQWAIVQKGQCADAVYLPYPPWDLTRKGTYYGARLVRLYECGK